MKVGTFIYRLIYVGNGMQSVKEQKLLASDGGANDNYGFSVSVFSNDNICVSSKYRFDNLLVFCSSSDSASLSKYKT